MSLYNFQLFIDSNNVLHSWIAFLSQRVFCHNFLEQRLHLEDKVCQSLRCEVTTLDTGIDLKALVPL